jgi:glycosyltransferase involved in cell wall biosynthesis
VIVGGKKVDSYWLMVNGGSEGGAVTPSPFRGEGGGEGVSSRIIVEWKSGLSEEELANEYDNATVYLHLARYESFGVPLIEAAAHGVPIVSTRVGIAPELLEGELAACLVNGDDPEACAQVIGWAIQERARIRVRLLERHRESFTRDRMTQQYLGNLE